MKAIRVGPITVGVLHYENVISFFILYKDMQMQLDFEGFKKPRFLWGEWVEEPCCSSS